MIISKEMTEALNAQIQAEMQSAYLYLSMAAWYEANDLAGFAHWMRKQYHEEVEHAMKMFDYLNERGGRVELRAIEAPKREWEDLRDVFRNTYEHEKSVTQMIYRIVDRAAEEKDYASVEFLNWFVKEQVEEEDTASTILAKLEKIGDCTAGLLALDAQLGAR